MQLRSMKGLENFMAMAVDGEVGTVDDIYFDGEKWAIRYLAVDTGDWISKRDVLISPIAVRHVDWTGRSVQTNLTRQQICDSPGADAAKPVTREHEAELHRYYGYPYYWTGPYTWGDNLYPGLVEERPTDNPEVQRAVQHAVQMHESADPHLCSSKDVYGYAIRTTDDTVGHVSDFLFDDDDWSVQYMVVDPRNWWPGKHVLVPRQLIEHVSWDERCVVLGITREELANGPEYDARHPPPRPARAGPELRR